jgi:hypothetical protein
MRKIIKTFLLCTTLASAMLLSGCGGDGGASGTASNPGQTAPASVTVISGKA